MPAMTKKVFISVIGSSQASAQEIRDAEEVGRQIARSQAVLVCGGMGGIMEAACRGASEEGGLTVGILPTDSRKTANFHVDIPIVTGMGYARNLAVVKSGQAVIAVGGSYGTLSEIAHALQSDLPVIGLNTWQISRDNKYTSPIIGVKTPAEAVAKALEMIREV